MNRVVLLLASVGLALVLASGVAAAASFRGTNGADTIRGTP